MTGVHRRRCQGEVRAVTGMQTPAEDVRGKVVDCHRTPPNWMGIHYSPGHGSSSKACIRFKIVVKREEIDRTYYCTGLVKGRPHANVESVLIYICKTPHVQLCANMSFHLCGGGKFTTPRNGINALRMRVEDAGERGSSTSKEACTARIRGPAWTNYGGTIL
jgi:hypothetical protein